jgi:hypothetical protein
MNLLGKEGLFADVVFSGIDENLVTSAQSGSTVFCQQNNQPFTT